MCVSSCSTFVGSFFYIISKFSPSTTVNFFTVVEPVLAPHHCADVSYETVSDGSEDLAKLRRTCVRILKLVKPSILSAAIITSGWESIALYNLYQINDLYLYDVLWSIRMVIFVSLMIATWNVFLFFFITGFNLLRLRCQRLMVRVGQVRYDVYDVLLTYNYLLVDLKKFDNLSKYILAIFDICLLPTLCIVYIQVFTDHQDIFVRTVTSLGLTILFLLLSALYVFATITNTYFNRMQFMFAKRLVFVLSDITLVRITHTESYKLSYLVCRIFKANPLGLVLVNMTVITKLKLFRTFIQVSRYCLLGYNIKHLLATRKVQTIKIDLISKSIKLLNF